MLCLPVNEAPADLTSSRLSSGSLVCAVESRAEHHRDIGLRGRLHRHLPASVARRREKLGLADSWRRPPAVAWPAGNAAQNCPMRPHCAAIRRKFTHLRPHLSTGSRTPWLCTSGPGARCSGAQTATIEPRSPRENGYVESVNARLRDELHDREIFPSLREAQLRIEVWRRHDNTARYPSALGCRPPASEKPSRGQPAHPAPLRSAAWPAWPRNPPCTNIPPGPIDRGWSAS